MKKLILALALLALCVPAQAQFSKSLAFKGAAVKKVAAGGGGGGAFTLVDHSSSGASSVTTTTTTLSTSGCKLLVISMAYRRSGGGTDNGPTCNAGSDTAVSGNIAGGPSGNGTNQMYYVINPTQTATYTIVATRDYIVVSAESFSYSGTTPTFDGASGSGSDSYTTIQPGTLTPSGSELFVTGLANVFQSTETATINSSFTKTDQLLEATGGCFGAMAYKLSSTAENPTWTSSTSGVPGGAGMLMFK